MFLQPVLSVLTFFHRTDLFSLFYIKFDVIMTSLRFIGVFSFHILLEMMINHCLMCLQTVLMNLKPVTEKVTILPILLLMWL